MYPVETRRRGVAKDRCIFIYGVDACNDAVARLVRHRAAEEFQHAGAHSFVPSGPQVAHALDDLRDRCPAPRRGAHRGVARVAQDVSDRRRDVVVRRAEVHLGVDEAGRPGRREQLSGSVAASRPRLVCALAVCCPVRGVMRRTNPAPPCIETTLGSAPTGVNARALFLSLDDTGARLRGGRPPDARHAGRGLG